MEERFNPANKALKAVMKGDAGRFLGLEKKQSAVLDVMKKQKIATDPSKLANYRKKEFLSGIDREKDLGFYAKKALHEAYGEKKTAKIDSRVSAADAFAARKKTYDEIVNKGKNLQGKANSENLVRQNAKVLYFDASVKNVRAAGELLKTSNNQAARHSELQLTPDTDEKNSDVKDILKRIQA